MNLTLYLKVQIQDSVLGHEMDRARWRNEDKCFIYSSGNSGNRDHGDRQVWLGTPRLTSYQQSRPGGGWRRGGESEARGMKQPPPRWTRKRNRLPCSGCLLLFITIPPLEEGGQNIPRFKNPFCTGSRTEIRCLRVFSWLHHALTSQLPDRG